MILPPTLSTQETGQATLWARRLGWLFVPPALLCILVLAWYPLSGTDDVWAHAAIGSWIWRHGAVPHQSLFLWGAPPIPWVAHSWLSQLAFFALLQNGGPTLVVLFTLAVVLLCFFIVYRVWTANAPFGSVALLAFCGAAYAGALRYRPRPELFTALFLVLLLVWLDAWWKRRAEYSEYPARALKAVFALLVLFVAWANFHGAVLLGLLVLFLAALGDALQNRFEKASQLLLVSLLVAALGTLLNPFGAAVLQESLSSAQSGMFARIDEWKPPRIERVLHDEIVVEFALASLALMAWARNKKRRWAHAAWVIIFAAMFWMQRRHLWLMANVSLFVCAANARFLGLDALWNGWRRLSRQPQVAPPIAMRVLSRAALVVVCGALAFNLVKWRRADVWPPRITASLPQAAARFVQEKKLRGHIFNDYENSSYLQWAWNGQGETRPLYIDLLNAYPPSLLEEYLVVIVGGDGAQRILDARQVGYIVLGDDKRGSDLNKWLRKNPRWRLIFDQGGDGLVWERVRPMLSTQERAAKSS